MNKLLSVILALVIALNLPLGYTDNLLHIYYLEVGQGDAILIKTTDSKELLIDTGPDSSVLFQLGEVLPYWDKSLDIVLITHSDFDHIGGLIDLLGVYNVEHILMNTTDDLSAYQSYAFEKLTADGTRVSGLYAGDSFQLGCCVQIEVIWPRTRGDLDNLGSNNSSIAFILTYGTFRAYFGGDLESPYEFESVEGKDIDIDILKAGHHGSKTSSSHRFIKEISPELVIISAGRDNKFGHPHQEVLDTYRQQGLTVRRTDLEGRVEITVDNNGKYL
ncbi:MAG: ComEC/Rec2 family competence protein [Candidatus Dojkabacteria bacterium]